MENEIGPIYIDVDGKRVEIYARYEEEEEGFVISANSPDGTATEIYVGFDAKTKEIIFDGFSEKGKSMHNFAAEFPIGEEEEEKQYIISQISREEIISLITYYAILNNIGSDSEAKIIPSRMRNVEKLILKSLHKLFENMNYTEMYNCIEGNTNILKKDEEKDESDIKISIVEDRDIELEGIEERRLRQFCESLEGYIELLRRKSDMERLAQQFAKEAEEERKQGNEDTIEKDVAEAGILAAQKIAEKAKIVADEEVLYWIQKFIKNKKITEIKYLLSAPKEDREEDLEERDDDDDMYPENDEYDGDEYGNE